MTASLDFFYRFYQVYENSQKINLSHHKNKYLFSTNHPDFEKVSQAAKALYEGTKMLPAFCGNIFKVAHTKWLIRKGEVVYSQIQNSPSGPGSSNVLRVVMNHFLKKIIASKKLNIVLPEEFLVEKSPSQHNQANTFKDFFVISKELNVSKITLSTLEDITFDRQQEIALTICRFIYHSGFMDANLDNIVLNTEGNPCIVDTEAHNVLHDASEDYSPMSLCNARIVGLKEFIEKSKEANLPSIFTQTAQKYLFFARVMKVVSYAAICLSVICPLIPIIILITSLAMSRFNNAREEKKISSSSALDLETKLCYDDSRIVS